LRNDSRDQAGTPRSHYLLCNLLKPLEVRPLAPIPSFHVQLGKVHAKGPVDLYIDEAWREDVSAEVDDARRGKVGGVEGGLAGDDLAGGGGDVEVGFDSLGVSGISAQGQELTVPSGKAR
jgi:hypothetical protein